jgi:hypothetical protein
MPTRLFLYSSTPADRDVLETDSAEERLQVGVEGAAVILLGPLAGEPELLPVGGYPVHHQQQVQRQRQTPICWPGTWHPIPASRK